MKVFFGRCLAWLGFMAVMNPGLAHPGNLLFSEWQPRLALLQMVPTGQLQKGVDPFPGIHAAMHTPYAVIAGQTWQGFAEMGYAYWQARQDQDRVAFDVHVVRVLVGLAMPIPMAPWVLPRVGLGYHYLRGNRVSGPSDYAFIEDGESEVAWHFGFAFEPESEILRPFFMVAGFDGVPTQPKTTWIGLLAIGWRW